MGFLVGFIFLKWATTPGVFVVYMNPEDNYGPIT